MYTQKYRVIFVDVQSIDRRCILNTNLTGERGGIKKEKKKTENLKLCERKTESERNREKDDKSVRESAKKVTLQN